MLIDPLAERVPILERLGTEERNDWRRVKPAGVPLPGLRLATPHPEIVATG